MRIAFLTSEYGEYGPERGGLGYHLARVVPMLARRGYECVVFLCSGRADDESGDLTDDGVHVRRIVAGSSPFDDLDLPPQVRHHLRSAWAVAEALAATSRETRFDVVQVPNYGVAGLFVDVASPVVMRFSSHAPTWHRAGGSPPDRRTILSEFLQRRAIERADLFISPSRYVADLLEQELALRVQVVRPPAPTYLGEAAWETDWVDAVTRGRPYLVHAGQLGPAKGTDIVLEAADAVLAEFPALDLHLCGRDAGAGRAIERLRSRYGDRVQWHGRVPPSRLHPLVRGAVAALYPSRADNLPNVVIESMCLGAVVVGVKGASIDELIVDGQSGFLAETEDPFSLAERVRHVVRLPGASRAAVGQAARQRIRKLLDEEACVRALVDVYERAGADGARPRNERYIAARLIRADLLALRQCTEGRASRKARGLRGRLLSLRKKLAVLR